MRTDLSRLLSRTPHDVPVVLEDNTCFVAKVDTGAYGAPAYRVDPDGNASFLVGHPVLPRTTGESSRDKQLAVLHDSWVAQQWLATARTRGVFCAAHYAPGRRELTVVADRLGVRPLYYYCDDRYFVFATALRILEQLPAIPKVVDLRGVAELSAFGYCLGVRTPYVGIRTLRAGEMVHASPAACKERTYWRWDSVAMSGEPEDALADRAFLRFKEAVEDRLEPGRTAQAFLSGGLDSRAIVTMLHALGADLRTFNFSRPRSQDGFLARAFAECLGLTHVEHPMPAGIPQLHFTIADVLGAQHRNRIVWSGDGGSVGLGLVYMSPAIAAAMRSGDRRRAIRTYFEGAGVSPAGRLLTREAAEQLDGVLETGVKEELSSIGGEDPGRAFFYFLMANDQRRHLARHFEEIDLHRIEFSLPFFDGAFLESIFAVPLDLCLGHKFYMKWLGRFPASTVSVPWQTYPGHLPCPLPIDPHLGYQWNQSWQRFWGPSRAAVASRGFKIACASDFPASTIRRSVLAAASLLHALGVADYGYLINSAEIYRRYSPAAVSALGKANDTGLRERGRTGSRSATNREV